jgi:hypothetical protein
MDRRLRGGGMSTGIAVSDYSKPFTNLTNFLPSVLSTEINKNIFSNLYNRFTTKDESVFVAGAIGAPNSKFPNILEQNDYAQKNQFQNVPNVTIGTQNYYIDFDLFFNKLKNLGVDPTQFNQWGALQTFNFAPPIDFDKLINYQDYYWDTTVGGNIQDYITIKNEEVFTETKKIVYLNNIISNLQSYQLQNVNGQFFISGNLTNILFLNNAVLLSNGSDEFQLNQIISLQYSAQFNKTIIIFKKPVDNSYTNLCSLNFKIISSTNGQFVINGDVTGVLNNNLIFLTYDTENVMNYWTLGSAVYDSTAKVTYITPVQPIQNSPQVSLSLSPLISLYSEESNYYLNNAITTPINSLISEIDIGKIIWFTYYGLYTSSTGSFNFSNPGVLFDAQANFTNLGIQAGDTLIITSGANIGNYQILNTTAGSIGVDIQKPFYSESNVNYTISKTSSIVDITTPVQPSAPTIFQLWYSSTSDKLFQWNGTAWNVVINTFSLLLKESNQRYITNHLQTNPWSKNNAWKHKSIIQSYKNMVGAQMPIIEFDSYLSLSNISYYTYDWKYRANAQSAYADSSPPILFEIANLSNVYNNSFSFKDQQTIIFDERLGNLATGLTIGSKIQLKGFAQNNGLYTIANVQYKQETYGARFQTVLSVTGIIPNVFDLPAAASIGPQFTSRGDVWLGYDQHWLFNGIDNVVPSSLNPTPNPMISYYVKSFTTDLYESNLSLYSQEFHFLSTTSNPTITFDESIANVVLFDNYQEGDLRVYINGVRQYGNYQDVRSAQLYEYVGGIVFDNVAVTPADVIRIEVGEYALSDIGLGAIPLVSEENISGQTSNYKLFNISSYRKTEQTKMSNNDTINFTVFDMYGNPLPEASIIFDYANNNTDEVNPYIDRRISFNPVTGDYGFRQYLSLSNGSLLFYKNIDGSLQSIWRAGNNGEKIVPTMLPDGTWDIPTYWEYNLEHLLYSQFNLSQISEHFQSLMASQTFLGMNADQTQNYYFIKSNPNYALGGTIKNSNGNLDLLVSALLVDNVDPLTVIDFAKNMYYSQVSFIRNSLIENVASYLISDSSTTYATTRNNILTNIINLFINNEKNDKWFGDSTSFVGGVGIKNWIASPAIFGMVPPTVPYADVDTGNSLYEVINHFGARIDTSLNNATFQLILTSLRNYSNNISNQEITSDVSPFPSGKYSNGSLLIRNNTTAGTYAIYRFSTINSWELVDLNQLYTNILLNIENNLFAAVPQYPSLKYNFNDITNNSNYYNLYQNKFLKYCRENGIALPFKNLTYVDTDPFSWNYYYSTVTTYPSNIHYIQSAASYQSLYQNAFGTPHPHLEPWKLQGYSFKPNWWDTTYLSTSGSRRWHSFMWYNILNGIVPYNKLLPDNVTLGSQAIGQLKVWNYLPVNMGSQPTADGIQPDELLPPYWNSSNSSDPQIRSLFDINDSDVIILPNSDYVFGDGNINEFNWKNSIDYPYALMDIAFLIDPINFFSDSFGSDYLPIGCLNISTDTQSVASHNTTLFHGQFNGNSLVQVNGLNQWYVHYNRYYGYDGDSSLFYKMWTGWKSSLAYEFNAFIETNSLFLNSDFFDVSTKDYSVDFYKKNAYQQIGFDTFNVGVLSVPSLYSPARDYGNGWSFQINTTSGKNINYFGVQNYEMNLLSDQVTFVINNYPVISAGITPPSNYISIDYNNSLTLTSSLNYDSLRTYTASIEINNVTYNLSISGSQISTVSQLINYINGQLNDSGYIELNNGNLRLISTLAISITDFGVFNSLSTNFISISASIALPYSFDNYFVVEGNKTLQLEPNSVFTITSSTQFNGTYSVISVHYDINTESSTIYVTNSNVLVTSNIVDGIVVPFNSATLPSSWTNGTEVYLSTTSALPSPLNDQTPYYITVIGPYSFKLSNSLAAANNQNFITCYNSGQGINYVGKLQATFTALGGAVTDYSWRRFETDPRYVKTRQSSFSLASIQNFNNFIDGYGDYLEANNISNTANDTDPNTGRLNSWQLEKEKFITSIYQINSINQSSQAEYNITVDLPNNRFVYVGYNNMFVTGQQILLFAGTASALPAPFNNPFMQFIVYYIIVSNDLKGFQVAASYSDAINGKAIQIDGTGSGTLYFELASNANYPIFNINPYKASFTILTPVGILDKIGSNSLNNIFVSKIYDQYFNSIDSKNIIVYRCDDSNIVKLLDGITNTYLSSFVGYVSEFENILLFENYSTNNDIIYDPFFGLTTPYFYVEFNKQNNQVLRYSFGGYVLIDDVFYRNLESYTQILRNMYDSHSSAANSNFVSEMRQSLGYVSGAPYFQSLDISDQTRFLFYQGMIKNKGANISVNAFLNQPRYASADLDEYWAYKVATYGDSKPKNYPQMFLEVSDSTNREARFEFVENGASPVDISYIPISLNNMARWYDQPDVVNEMAPASQFYFGADIFDISTGQEHNIRFVSNYGIYVIDLLEPCDGVILTNFDTVEGKQVTLVNTVDYVMLNARTVQLLTQSTTGYLNLTLYKVRYNYDAHNGCEIVDKEAGVVVDKIPILNPVYNQYNPFAYAIVDYHQSNDPALYNYYGNGQAPDNNAWFNLQVDKVWFDSNNEVYVPYNDPAIFNNNGQIFNWANLAPFASIDLYQWTKSIYPPSTYTANTKNGIPKQHVYQNTGTAAVPVWQELYNLVFNYSAYEMYGLSNPTTGTVQIYRNGVFDLSLDLGVYTISDYVDLNVSIPNQTSKPYPSDYISIIQQPYQPTAADLQNNLYKIDTNYSVVSEINPLDGNSIDYYFYWVSGRTDIEYNKIKNDTLTLASCANSMLCQSSPYMIIGGIRYSNDFGFGILFGNTFDEAPYDLPVRYTQMVLRGLNSIVSQNNRYTIRIINDYTLRGSLATNIGELNFSSPGEPTPLSLNNVHTEWTLFREHQFSPIDRYLWDAITSSMIGYVVTNGAPDLSSSIPSQNRILYDSLNNATTSYGLEEGQIFMDSASALNIITSILNDPTQVYANIDINQFLLSNNFDSLNNIVNTMNAIYTSFAATNINYMFFQCLYHAMSLNLKNKEIFKTSWVALDIAASPNNVTTAQAPSFNLVSSQGCVPSLTFTISPSRPIPSPSPTPSVTPYASITPSVTQSVTASMPLPSPQTPTPTPSITQSVTPTRTINPSSTVTPSVTLTSSLTPTISVTPSVTQSPNQSPTQTPSQTPSSTITPTVSLSVQIYPSVSTTPTPTPTPTTSQFVLTPSPSATPTPTVTPSGT